MLDERRDGTEARVNVVCLKWGAGRTAAQVNRLYRGVRTHLARPFRFVCLTDDASGLEAGVESCPLPPEPVEAREIAERPAWPNGLALLALFEKGLAGLSGPTLVLDLDVLVLGPLDAFFDYRPGAFCIVRNWTGLASRVFRSLPFCGNACCFRFEAGGRFDYVYRRFLLELGVAYASGESLYLTHAVGLDVLTFWPEAFVRSYYWDCARGWPLNVFLPPRRPREARLLVFGGKPSAEAAATQGWRGSRLRARMRPARWVAKVLEGFA